MSLFFILLQFFPPLLLLGMEEERGGVGGVVGDSVPFLNIQNACSFVSSIKHRIMRGDIFFLEEGREKIIKTILGFLLVCFNAPKLPGGMNL